MAQQNITTELLRKILATAKATPNPEFIIEDYLVHDWHKPRHFRGKQINALKDFIQRSIEQMSIELEKLYQNDITISMEEIEEKFIYSLIKEDAQNDTSYFLNFQQKAQPSPENMPVSIGFLDMPSKSAISFVKLILGDSKDTDENESKLSSLEEVLILDTSQAIIEAISKKSNELGGEKLESDSKFTRGHWPLESDNLDEFLRLTFTIESNGKAQTIYINILSSFLDKPLKINQNQSVISQEMIDKALMENLEKTSISIKTRLASVTLALNDITALEPGDMVLLNRTTDEPMEILLNGKTKLYAHPSVSGGCYAASITQKPQE